MKFYFTVNLLEEFFLRFHFLWKVLFLQMNKKRQNMTVKLRVYFRLMKILHFWRLQSIFVKKGHTKASKPTKYCVLQVHRGWESRSCSMKWVRTQQLTIIPGRSGDQSVLEGFMLHPTVQGAAAVPPSKQVQPAQRHKVEQEAELAEQKMNLLGRWISSPLAPRVAQTYPAVTPSANPRQRKWQKHMAAEQGGSARLPFLQLRWRGAPHRTKCTPNGFFLMQT